MFTTKCVVNGEKRTVSFNTFQGAKDFIGKFCGDQFVGIVDTEDGKVWYTHTPAVKHTSRPEGLRRERPTRPIGAPRDSWVLGTRDQARLLKGRHAGWITVPRGNRIRCVSPFTTSEGSNRKDRELLIDNRSWAIAREWIDRETPYMREPF